MRRRGFTLVELLVVVAIVGILAALLMPALSRAKFQGRNAKCKSNARQIGIALSVYVSSHHEFPVSAFDTPLLPNMPRGKFWWDLLGLPGASQIVAGPLTNLPGVFQCPFQRPVRAWLSSGNQVSEIAVIPVSSYGYNGWGVGTSLDGLGLGGVQRIVGTREFLTPVREGAVEQPSNLVAIGDGFQRSMAQNLDGAQMIIMPAIVSPWAHGYATFSEAFKKSATFRAHRGRFNRVFCDGHVEREDLNPDFDPSDAYLARWNHDNLPHRSQLAN